MSRTASQRGSLATRAVFLGPGLLFTAVFVAVPVLLVLSYTVFDRGRFGGVEYEFTLDNFTRAFEPTFRKVLVSSLGIAASATLIALAIGYPVAYAIAKLPSRWRSLMLVLVVIPFWTNFLIRTYAWIVLLNTQGVLNDALVGLGVIDERLNLLYTRGAVVAGLVYVYLPLMILPIYAVGGPAGPRAPRGVLRPRRRPLHDVRQGDAPALPARCRDRLHLRVRAEPRQLRRPRAAGRRQDRDGRQPGARPVPQGPRLAVRRDARAASWSCCWCCCSRCSRW